LRISIAALIACCGAFSIAILYLGAKLFFSPRRASSTVTH
jgi:hypothetical protein